MAAAAAMFAACSDDAKELNAPELATNPTEEVAQGQVPVAFSAYVNRATTRAGEVGNQTLPTLMIPWAPSAGTPTYGGFGVFGYYTDNNDYDQLATPNFFYNQLVEWDGTNNYWKYEPVRYWPNEYGSSAVSDDADRISFFAYAPYVEVTPSNGKPTDNNTNEGYGITGISRNTASGDPIIKYVGSFDNTKAVDLMWGVSDGTDWPVVIDGTDQTLEAGKPWLNVERPSNATQNLKFNFRHALAKVNIMVDAFVDGTDNTKTLAVDGKTRIWIRSVKFTGFAMKGALNLNNETANKPYWMNYNGIGDLETDDDLTVYDGLKDGKEGVANAEASNEKVRGFYSQFVETDASFDYSGSEPTWAASGDHKDGVTNSPKPLFTSTGDFFVIPTDDNVTIEITYDVETIDNNLGTRLADAKTYGTSIENRITKEISFGGDTKLEAGKYYTVKLHLGMNSVEFDADVIGWEEQASVEADLPANVAFYEATNAGNTGNATIAYDATSFALGINGLDGGEAVTAEAGSSKYNDATNSATETADTYLTAPSAWSAVVSTNANSSGYEVVTLTTSKNPTTSNRTQKVKWTGGTSGNYVTVTFTQQAHPLNLKEPASKAIATHKATIRRSIDFTDSWGWFCLGLSDDCAVIDGTTNTNGDPEKGENGIVVYRNGTKLTWVASGSGATAGQFEFGDTSGDITFGEDPVAGDIIKVVLKTGDAPAETITWTVE